MKSSPFLKKKLTDMNLRDVGIYGVCFVQNEVYYGVGMQIMNYRFVLAKKMNYSFVCNQLTMYTVHGA
jgi:hypothetical protein